MARDRQGKSPSDLVEQKILNWSFDKKWKTLVFQLGAECIDGPLAGQFITLKAKYNADIDDYELLTAGSGTSGTVTPATYYFTDTTGNTVTDTASNTIIYK